jgi:pimeloyl-ACP methyl ester carboxylesterase
MQLTTETQIRPFRVQIPQADLDDLHRRLAHTRWPAAQPAGDWRYGVPLDYLQELTSYWDTGYDWRVHEAHLNSFPQHLTTIDGADVHFLHVRSPHQGALPLLVSHGWPGSVVELLDLIGPLTDPPAHGGDPRDAFHVVVPSLPGFGFSGPTREAGWTTHRIAAAFAELMARLGYDRYGAQGGDVGAMVSPELGRIDADHVVGVHVNAASVGFIPLGPVDPAELAELTPAEKARLERIEHFRNEEFGYNLLQSTRPQTIAYALTDSPVGQLAWIVEKFKAWTDPAAELPEDAVDRDRLLTNVMVYWLTGTAGSSARWYYESAHDPAAWAPKERSATPTGVVLFGQDVAIRRFGERQNTIVHWSESDRGGHFAAMEVPDLLVEDVRTFFRALR